MHDSGAAGCKKSLFSIHIKLFTLFLPLQQTSDLVAVGQTGEEAEGVYGVKEVDGVEDGVEVAGVGVDGRGTKDFISFKLYLMYLLYLICLLSWFFLNRCCFVPLKSR